MGKKSTTDELVKAISSKKKSQPKKEVVKAFFIDEVWNSRPLNWLGVFLSYLALAYAGYEIAKYYIGIPEFNGIIAFVLTLAVGSRAFRR